MSETVKNAEPEYKGSYDVIVVGGGIAGVSASVAAARKGAKVLLIEKSCNLGGLATGGLISWYEPLCDGNGKQIFGGIAEELIKLATKYGFDNLPKQWGGEGRNEARNHRYSTYYSPTLFSAALDSYVIENGVDLRFDTLSTFPVMKEHLCQGILCESVNGREYFQSKFLIDATGDATVMHRAGVPTENGKNFVTYISHYCDIEMAKELCEKKDFSKFRRWINTGSDMFGNGHPKGVDLICGVTAEEITRYMIEGKKALLERISRQSRNDFDLMSLPTMPQLRTIRRIIGNADFSAIDGECYEDSIGNCSDFRPDGAGKHYQIPLGALYNKSFPNLMAAGRIISSPQGDGWEVARVIPTCALTGEAAGNAVAVCAQENLLLTELSLKHMERIRVNGFCPPSDALPLW